MAMVVNANRKHDGLGGHISTFASSATLYEVAYNHFSAAATKVRSRDLVYFRATRRREITRALFLKAA